ncbi:MAG: AI-2E family transporter [Nocardioidaceae bacterium]|nr:AI-2E family transporter [Nocardioidaceae bacterium]
MSDEAEQTQREEERLRERFAQQLSQQWGQVREARRRDESVLQIETGPSNFSRAQVPWAFDLAAAWAWRLIVIGAAGYGVFWLLGFFSEIVFPVVIALFIAALTAPLVSLGQRMGIPRKLAAFIVVLGGIAVIALLLTFVTQQVASGAGELSDKVAGGLDEIRNWLKDGPLNVSDSQIDTWIENAQKFVQDQGKELAKHATELGATVSHILAGFFIVLFATYFFLADGHLIWAWVVRIFPRAARTRVDSSGKVAWVSLTQFVRATVLVAGTDALGIMIFAAILKVPLVSAIGVLVFLGAFVPLVGAFVSGTVAVLVALVAHGPIVALIMLGGVVLVQQIEAHVLQPFLMGRFVSVHPLGVILAIAAGILVAGIAGALVAVPLAAALNAVVQHLATYTEVGESPEEASAEDPREPLPEDMAAEAAGQDAGEEGEQ